MGKSEVIDLTDVDKLFEGRLSKQQKLMKTYVSRYAPHSCHELLDLIDSHWTTQ